MIKATLDTNVLISGTLFSGAPSRVLELAFERKILCVTSFPLIEEFKAIMKEKMKVEDDFLNQTVAALLSVFQVVSPTTEVEYVKNNYMDNIVIATAIDSGSDYLVTGDKKHLLKLHSVDGVPVIAPADFLKIIQ